MEHYEERKSLASVKVQVFENDETVAVANDDGNERWKKATAIS